MSTRQMAKNREPRTTAVYVDREGRPIPNRELEQNLYEYLVAWRKLAPQLLLIELGTVPEEYSLETLDVAYQLYVLHTVYPIQALAVAFILAIVPYLVLRGLVTRLARANRVLG